MTVKEKFWSKVDKTSNCWKWMGNIRPASGFRNCRICQLTSKRKYNSRKRLVKFT